MITVSTRLRTVFTKIIKNNICSATHGLTIIPDSIQLFLLYTFKGLIRFTQQDELLVGFDICKRVKHDRLCRHTITTGSSYLLVIVFNILGQIKMNDPPDIRFIDAHTKGNGGANNLNAVESVSYTHLRAHETPEH